MNEGYVEKIERYCKGEMSDAEKSLFETDLQTNQELSSLYNLYGIVDKEMQQEFGDKEGQAALKNSLETLSERYFTGTTREVGKNTSGHRNSLPMTGSTVTRRVVKLHMFRNLAVAAAILGLIALGVVWYRSNDTTGLPTVANNENSADTGEKGIAPNDARSSTQSDNTKVSVPEGQAERANGSFQRSGEGQHPATRRNIKQAESNRLYAAYYKRPDMEENETGLFQREVAFMQTDQPERALRGLNDVDVEAVSRGQKTDTQSIKFYKDFYRAICFLEMDSIHASIEAFNQALRNSPDNTLQTEAAWYKALALIKANRIKEAEQLLQKLSGQKTESDYKKNAARLLIQLNS